MKNFSLKIITAEGVKFDGQAENVLVRSVGGDVGIRANHIDYVTALGTGKAVVTTNGQRRTAACSRGVLTVISGEVTVLASTFEWANEIDIDRARQAAVKAKQRMANAGEDKREYEAGKHKLQRANTRIRVADSKEK